MFSKFLTFLFLILILVSSVHAVGIAFYEGHAAKYIQYEPGKKYEFTFALRPNDPGLSDYHFFTVDSTSSNLSQYVRFKPDEFTDIPQSKNLLPFKVIVEFPDEEIVNNSGLHKIRWGIKESGAASNPAGNGMRAYAAASALIFVRIKTDGIDVRADLDIPNANLDETVIADVKISNWGTIPIKIGSADITIYDSKNNSVKEVRTDPVIDVETYDQVVSSGELITKGLPPGSYHGRGTFTYLAGNGVEATIPLYDNFTIGAKTLILLNHTQNITQDVINPFHINFTTDWLGELRGVRAITEINGDEFETPTKSVPSKRTTTFTAFVDANGYDLGMTDIDIIGYIGDEPKRFKSRVLVVPNEKQSPFVFSSTTSILILVIIILVLINVFFIILSRRKGKDEKHKKKRH